MELTPIKIPGKRRQKGEPVMAYVACPKKKAKKVPKEKKAKKVKSSCLERVLPLEIVERIFWLSENVNFVKSGQRIGRLLSGEQTRRETFIQAFGPTWDVWFGCLRGPLKGGATVIGYHGWRTDSSRFGGNPEFQSALLRYSWVNVSFILECWDIWTQRHARDRYFQHYPFWGADMCSINTLKEPDEGGFNNVTKSGMQYFLHDYDAFCAVPRSFLYQSLDDAGYLEVHPDTEIPDELLTGPWDEEAVQKLFWLVRAGARLSENQTWETTLEGFHNATTAGSDPDKRIILLFYMLSSFKQWPTHILQSVYRKMISESEKVWQKRQHTLPAPLNPLRERHNNKYGDIIVMMMMGQLSVDEIPP